MPKTHSSVRMDNVTRATQMKKKNARLRILKTFQKPVHGKVSKLVPTG